MREGLSHDYITGNIERDPGHSAEPEEFHKWYQSSFHAKYYHMMLRAKLEDFISEDQIIQDLLAPRNKLIMVMGGADTGKTTLTECISDLLAKKANVGIIDLDMGQSHIGLPTTIAWAKIKDEFKGWQDIRLKGFYFTGTLSPAGSLLPALTGAKLITDKALSSCDKVVLDTTGLIAEPAGRVLKQYKIDILSPDIILALEHSYELEHILKGFKHLRSPKIYRLPVPTQIASKSVTKRTRYRIEKFASYFTGSHMLEISYRDIGLRFTREPMSLSSAELKNRIVSLRDGMNRDIALGIIEKIILKDSKLLIRSPAKKDVKFHTIVIGMVNIPV